MRQNCRYLMVFICMVLCGASILSARTSDFFENRIYHIGTDTVFYSLFIPIGYVKGTQYPLMLDLTSCIGNDWRGVYVYPTSEPWADSASQLKNPCFVVCAQTPNTNGGGWAARGPVVMGMLDSLQRRFGNIDQNRVYVSGVSFGGFGSWSFLGLYPTRFAAAMPMDGGAGGNNASVYKNIPIWCFASQDDSTVNISNTRNAVAAVVAAGGEPFVYPKMHGSTYVYLSEPTMDSLLLTAGSKHIYTEYVSGGHNCSGVAEYTPQLHPWIFAQKRDNVPPNAPANLTAGNIGVTSITLQWTKPTRASDGDTASWYIIFRNSTQIAKVYSPTFTDNGLAATTSYTYQVYAEDYMKNRNTTPAQGTYQTIADLVGPVVTSVLSVSLTQVQVFFDEALDQASAQTAANYVVSNGTTVSSAVLQGGGKSVMLTTTTQTAGTNYTLTISNVKDASPAKNTMAQTVQQFTAMYKFTDDFESGNISKWTPSTSANWTVKTDMGDKSLYIATTTPEKLLVNHIFAAMSFDVDIKGSGNIYRNLSVVFGYQDANNYYYMNFAGATNATYNGIFKVVGGVSTKLAEPTTALLTDTTQYHHVRVTWNGATGDIKAYFDQTSTAVCSANDKSITSGEVGLWSTAKLGYFDNVEADAWIRTDVVAIQDLPVYHIAGPGWYAGPNPVTMHADIVKLEQLKGVKIYDLSGHRINSGQIQKEGIYLLEKRGDMKKVMVIQ